MLSVLWETKESKDSVILTKDNGDVLILKVGDFIVFAGRTEGVIIQGFSVSVKEIDTRGPIGMYYLPWRPAEKRWATPVWSILKGNPRHIIAIPVGLQHYGEIINWNTVEFRDHPSPPPSEPPTP